MGIISITLTGKQLETLLRGDTVRIEGVKAQNALMDIPDITIELEPMPFNVIKEHVLVAKREKNFGV